MTHHADEAIWPVDMEGCRLWPMESEDGPLLQELFDDLSDYSAAFGEPGAADAVSTFINLPEGLDYDAKLLLGLWKSGGLIGALDCTVGYPTRDVWTVGLLVVAERHRGQGVGTSVVQWLEATAAGRGLPGCASSSGADRRTDSDEASLAQQPSFSQRICCR